MSKLDEILEHFPELKEKIEQQQLVLDQQIVGNKKLVKEAQALINYLNEKTAEVDPNYTTTQWSELKLNQMPDDKEASFECFAQDDMQSEKEQIITIHAKDYPVGTRVVIQEPLCPHCYQTPDVCKQDEDCDFDWNNWALNRYQ